MIRTIRSLTIVIPLYNEAPALPDMFEALAKLRDNLVGIKLDVFFVDDHSDDSGPALLKAKCADSDWCTYFRLSRRSGSHVAIIAGMSHSTADAVAFIAADLQDPPNLLPEMIQLCEQGHDVVWATWNTTDSRSYIEDTASRWFHDLMRMITQSGEVPYRASFAMLSGRAAQHLCAGCGQRPSLIMEIPKLGFDVATIAFDKPTRSKGRSKWTLGRKLLAFADAFVASTYLPIRIMSYAGIGTSLIGFLYAIILIVLRATGLIEVEGWTSLMVVMLILGGLQMMMLGVLGEYLWRTKLDTGKHPVFIIQDRVGPSNSEDD